MSPAKKKQPAKKKRAGRKRSSAKQSPKAEILRTTHVYRSRAHTAAAGRRRQARRDTK